MDLKINLINKAKELGFSSQLLPNEPLEENEDIRYYLWLHEFRKYLAEKMNSKLYKITVNDLSDDVDVNLMYIIQYFIKD